MASNLEYEEMHSIDDLGENSLQSLAAYESEDCFITGTSFHGKLMKQMTKMWRNSVLTDTVLTSGETEVQCHGTVLAAASPFLCDVLKAEEKSKRVKRISIPSVQQDVLLPIVEFLYTMKLKIRVSQLPSLVLASIELNLPDLRDLCDEFIAQRINAKNCLGYYAFAKSRKLSQTCQAGRDFMKWNPQEILNTAQNTEFLALNKEDLVTWLSDDNLYVPDESLTFQIIEKWVTVDESRLNDPSIETVVNLIRLELCSAEFLISVVEKSEMMKCGSFVKKARDAKSALLLNETTAHASKPKPRTCNMKLMILGGWKTGGYTNETRRCWIMNSDGSDCHKSCKLPTKYPTWMGACVTNGSLIICGGNGFHGGGCHDIYTAWEYVLDTKTWSELPTMHYSRYRHGVVAVGDKVYAIGGRSSGSDLKQVEVLSLRTRSWSLLSSMPGAMENTAVHIDGSIYAVNGKHQIILKYDITRNSWFPCEKLPWQCTDSGVVSYGSNVYVVGGRQGSTLCYNTTLNSWSALCPAPTQPYAVAVQFGGKIYLAGGRDMDRSDTDYVRTVEEYDIAKNEWMTSSIKLPRPLRGFCMVCVR